MDYETLGLLLALAIWCIWAMVIEQCHRRKEELGRLPPPPGPKGWPVVGNIFQLGWPPHVSFMELAHKYGPIMTVQLGAMNTVVISSNNAAHEMFKNHAVVLAGRKIYEAMKGKLGNEGSIVTAQYGPYWRMLKRLCTTEFFITSRLDAMQGVRKQCIDRMVQYVEEASGCGSNVVDFGRFVYLMTFNLLGNLMFSRDLLDPKSKKGAVFFHHAGIVMELAGKPNVADFFPILRWLDPQGIKRKSQFHIMRAFDVAGGFMKERMESKNGGGGEAKRKDYLDVLLEFHGAGTEEPAAFSSTAISAIVIEMFIAGTDTMTSTLEWARAMAEILHNPTVLRRAQAELQEVVGPNRRLEEKDLDNLPYLQAVVKETLRLHPPAPFLVPHMAMNSCEMLGYHIPKETQVLVNVWAIGRDTNSWKDPQVFKPEVLGM